MLLVAQLEDGVSARACVPSHLVSDSFNAQLWLEALADVLGGKVAAPKGQDSKYIVNMRPVQVPDKVLTDEALLAVLAFADAALTT